MIVMFTDFGSSDPYVGQVHAVLAQSAPGVPVIDLLNDVPACNIKCAAYLLPAYTQYFPQKTVFICTIDPGVGGPRRPLIVKTSGSWYIGPDNGLFQILYQHSSECQIFEINWVPEKLSSSFHGRDLFAPIAAQLVLGQQIDLTPTQLLTNNSADWPDDLAEIIYVDHYGNAITGIRASKVSHRTLMVINERKTKYAPVFDAVGKGEVFWYENANGLVEIASNGKSAASQLNITIGIKVSLV